MHNIIELESAVDVALGYDYKCMVEKSVENGREIECAILGNEAPEPSCLGEIIPGADFYNYETKYVDNKSQLVIPAVINAELSKSIQEQAVTAFRAVEAFGLSRVDFLLSTSNNEVLINAEKDYIRTGDFSTVKITAAEDFDLYAEVIVEK